jgi:hypothetical protein
MTRIQRCEFLALQRENVNFSKGTGAEGRG